MEVALVGPRTAKIPRYGVGTYQGVRRTLTQPRGDIRMYVARDVRIVGMFAGGKVEERGKSLSLTLERNLHRMSARAGLERIVPTGPFRTRNR